MRTAIVTGTYHKPNETFVNRHIRHLFGGAVCVVAQQVRGDDPLDVPSFAHRPADPPWTTQVTPEALANLWHYRNDRVPQGGLRRDLEAFLRAHDVQAVLSEFGNEAYAIAPVAGALGLPMFTYFRGYDASRSLVRAGNRMAYRALMPQLAGVFAVSRFLLDNLARHGIVHPYAVVIPSGVDVRTFVPGDKVAASVLGVGRLMGKKAPDLTIRAFLRVAGAHPGATLDLVGDGPLMGRCRALVADHPLGRRVTLHGNLPHDAVRAMMARSAIYAQHSVTDSYGNTEGLPTAIQEAMACGMVTVSTRHAGIPEAVTEGVTGWLCAENDEAGMAAALDRALSSDLTGMAAAARAVAVDRFDNDRGLADLQELMRAAV